MDFLKRSKFDKLVEKATSELLIEPDLENTLLICDLVRSQEITPKYCVQSIKKRMQNDNPNVVLHAIEVLESVMKNCGEPSHQEVANPEFMQCLVSLIDVSADVRAKLLECLQNWAYAFKDKSGYEPIVGAYEDLKNAGYVFPMLSESDAMFSVVCAPSWKEGNCCHRCKIVFTTFRRKHHCRNCGNIFCAECSSERAVLPKFGIEKEVRVCDHCFETLNKKVPSSENPKDKKADLDHEEQLRRERERKQLELQAQEAEELQLALALSASEAECKERERQGTLQSFPESYNQTRSHDQTGSVQLVPMLDTSEMDPELAQYLTRHYQRSRTNAQDSSSPGSGAYAKSMQALAMIETASHVQPSAPIYASPTPKGPNMASGNSYQPGMTENSYGPSKEKTFGTENSVCVSNSALEPSTSSGLPQLTDPKQEEFLNALRGSIEFFVNRLQSNSQRGRSIANDTTVQTLFRTLHEMHPQLLQYKKSTEECRAYFERFQDKLTQLREAREALDALRQDHRARRQLEEQEAARIRQLQMMQKLEVMRQQKRDHLEQKLRMAMEQTMQYQQQYQMGSQQPVPYGIDPNTGLPNMMPMGVYNQAYPPAGYAPVSQNQVAYGPTNMGPYCAGIPPDPASAYPQPSVNMAYSNHHQQHQQQQQPTNYMMQPSANQQVLPQSAYPVPNSTNDASAYCMYALEASLPPATTNLSANQIAHTQDPSRQPEVYIPSYDPNIPPPTANNQNFQSHDGHQPPTAAQAQPPQASYQPAATEAQLISFD